MENVAKQNNEKVLAQAQEQMPVVNSPASMILQAVKGDMDLDKIGKLMDYQERWEANEARKAYHAAMSAFKMNPPDIIKDKQVSFKTNAGTTSYKHASLFNVTKSINAALSKHGLSVSWETAQDPENKAVTVTCKITHVNGHAEKTSLTAYPDASGSKNGIQQVGSTISYLQRYTLLSLTGLAAADQDDDGRLSEPVEFIAEKELNTLVDYLTATDTNVNKFLAHFKIESLDKMPKKLYKQAIVLLEQKEKAQKNAKPEVIDVEHDNN